MTSPVKVRLDSLGGILNADEKGAESLAKLDGIACACVRWHDSVMASKAVRGKPGVTGAEVVHSIAKATDAAREVWRLMGEAGCVSPAGYEAEVEEEIKRTRAEADNTVRFIATKAGVACEALRAWYSWHSEPCPAWLVDDRSNVLIDMEHERGWFPLTKPPRCWLAEKGFAIARQKGIALPADFEATLRELGQ